MLVELARTGEESFVSRSQAKRIVARLERFKEVVLDCADVDQVGPAFADQIFRVFASKHPKTHLIPINMNEQVTRMVNRALSRVDPLVALRTTPPSVRDTRKLF